MFYRIFNSKLLFQNSKGGTRILLFPYLKLFSAFPESEKQDSRKQEMFQLVPSHLSLYKQRAEHSLLFSN